MNLQLAPKIQDVLFERLSGDAEEAFRRDGDRLWVRYDSISFYYKPESRKLVVAIAYRGTELLSFEEDTAPDTLTTGIVQLRDLQGEVGLALEPS